MAFAIGYGKVLDLEKINGYFKLTVTVDLPFKRRFLKFCLWDNSLLENEDHETIKIDDMVEVCYGYDGKFPRLLRIKPVSNVIDCLTCHALYEMVTKKIF